MTENFSTKSGFIDYSLHHFSFWLFLRAAWRLMGKKPGF
jgi:hypothetical protein